MVSDHKNVAKMAAEFERCAVNAAVQMLLKHFSSPIFFRKEGYIKYFISIVLFEEIERYKL